MKKIFFALTLLTLLSLPLAGLAQVPPGGCNVPPCTPDPEPPVPDNFQPEIQRTELQRAVTTGNPPQKPQWFMPILPQQMFRRPVFIPKSYPLRHQDGERFY